MENSRTITLEFDYWQTDWAMECDDCHKITPIKWLQTTSKREIICTDCVTKRRHEMEYQAIRDRWAREQKEANEYLDNRRREMMERARREAEQWALNYGKLESES